MLGCASSVEPLEVKQCAVNYRAGARGVSSFVSPDVMLEVLAIETMTELPIEDKVSMALAIVPREGVMFIQAGQTRIPLPVE